MAEIGWWEALLIVGMLVSGTLNTVSKSAQNDSRQNGYYKTFHCYDPTDQKDIDGISQANCTAQHYEWTTERNFNAPWFQTLIMFLGESLALLIFFIHQCRRASLERAMMRLDEQTPLIQETLGDPPTSWFQPILIVPTICDLIGTSLAGIGLLYVYPSVWQMLRGSIIVFTGLCTVFVLRRKLPLYRWVGIGVTVIGLIIVGLSSVLSVDSSDDSSHTKSQTILGIVLILLAQLVNAFQFVIEETFMKKRRFEPLLVVGTEGVIGILLMCAIVIPTIYWIPGGQPSSHKHGSYENDYDAAVMITNNWRLVMLCCMYCLSITMYNFCGLSVTKSLSAVHRTLIDACRTILVWGVEIVIYYGFHHNSQYGESWDKYSFLQLGGFVFLLLGTFIYNQVIRLPCLPGERPLFSNK